MGTQLPLEGIVEGVVCRFGEIGLTASLYVLDFKDFDVILGLDWLTEHKTMIDFWRCRVKLNVSRGDTI